MSLANTERFEEEFTDGLIRTGEGMIIGGSYRPLCDCRLDIEAGDWVKCEKHGRNPSDAA